MTIPEILKLIDEQKAIRDNIDPYSDASFLVFKQVYDRLGALFKLLADTTEGKNHAK